MQNPVGYFFIGLVLVLCVPHNVAAKITVFGAASLTQVLEEISADFTRETTLEVVIVVGGSGLLARQIVQGAPADICFLANKKWMDYLEQNKYLKPASRVNLLANRLVVIAPKGTGVTLKPIPESDFGTAFNGRLALADPAHVPAGMYTRQALEWLGWWPSVVHRLAPATDVRAALAYVERGACGVGIVYATDVAFSQQLEVVASLPVEAHEPIVYPAALVQGGAAPEASHFLAYLQSQAARLVYQKYGFDIGPLKTSKGAKAVK